MARLKDMFAGVREQSERRAQIMAVDREVARHVEFAGMIGRSQVMQEVFDLIRRMAPHVRMALVSGETGTGKSSWRGRCTSAVRRARRFVAVNCSAVVETLFESELFGHVRVRSPAPSTRRPGCSRRPTAGRCFSTRSASCRRRCRPAAACSEIGEVQRIGSLQPVRTDVRVVCASNRDLSVEAVAGTFRSDLLYRLNVVHIHLPSLRDRRDDIPYLTAAFVRQFSERFGKTITGLAPACAAPAERRAVAGEHPAAAQRPLRACMLADGPVISEREIQASIRPTTWSRGRRRRRRCRRRRSPSRRRTRSRRSSGSTS